MAISAGTTNTLGWSTVLIYLCGAVGSVTAGRAQQRCGIIISLSNRKPSPAVRWRLLARLGLAFQVRCERRGGEHRIDRDAFPEALRDKVMLGKT